MSGLHNRPGKRDTAVLFKHALKMTEQAFVILPTSAGQALGLEVFSTHVDPTVARRYTTYLGPTGDVSGTDDPLVTFRVTDKMREQWEQITRETGRHLDNQQAKLNIA